MKSLTLVTCLGLLAFVSADGQETQKFTFDIGAGFTNPVGNTANQLSNPGWNVGAGVGYNFSSYLGAKFNFGFNDMAVNSATVQSIGVPAGDVHVSSFTLDPVVHLTPKRRVDFYLTGGGGVFHVYQEFTQPTLGVTTVYNPFFGLYPVAFGANQILSSYSVNKPGFDVGAGASFRVFGNAKFFAEAKWDHVFMSASHIDYLPVTFGFRW